MQSDDSSRARLLGYSDRLSARQSESLTFFISAPKGDFKAEIRRLVSIDGREGAGGVRHELVKSQLKSSYEGVEQISSIGSYAEFRDSSLGTSGLPLTLTFSFRPTLLAAMEEVLVAFNGGKTFSGLKIVGGLLQVVSNGKAVTTLDLKLSAHTWYRAALVVSDNEVSLTAMRVRSTGRVDETVEATSALDNMSILPKQFAGNVTLAAAKADGVARHHFTGKIGDVAFIRGALSGALVARILSGTPARSIVGTGIIAAWSMGRNTASMTVPNDVDGGAELFLHNLPMRAVTGSHWRHKYDHPELVPEEYNAILFHSDMVAGGDWKPSLDLFVEKEWRSGIYALRVSDDTDEDWIPFYVRPAANAKHSTVLFLAPTNTYIAYGNAKYGDDLILIQPEAIGPQDTDKYVTAHPELGLSIYDNHKDGAGCAYASRLRPLLNFRPFHVSWLNNSYRHFAADFYLLDWLEHQGFEYDVLTDEDLHLEGVAALKPHQVVITGSHPEYFSERMLDAVCEYTDQGGNLMYLGGNGFYWPISFHPTMPHVIEIRRGHTGARTWTSPPGETIHAFTGEQGGLWRNRGRSPHALTGIGMGAVGWGKAAPYQPAPQAKDSAFAWVFEGVTEDLIGTEGMMLGGAAGDEIDHVDVYYGTPAETTILATSVGHSEHFQPVIEYYTNMLPGQGGSQNPLVRADMTWLPTAGGGAVFSVGSICWIGCLPINDYDNGASRVTLNVLNHFVGNR